MPHTITAEFDTRRAAEMAVEHLVQEYGVERTAIFVEAAEAANTAGTRRSGADAESGHPDTPPHGDPVLAGRVKVSADVAEDGSSEKLQAALREQGAVKVARH